ncbi:MAG: hypothetical protein ACOCV1_03690 [Bacillota bacterium]
MKIFIENSKIFDIQSDPNSDYDIMFCDTLELGKNISAKTKVYLACHYFEKLKEEENYESYEYFIGFGNDVYKSIENHIGFIPSAILDGFINNKKESSNEDFVFYTCKNNNPQEIYTYKISESIQKDFLSLCDNSGLKFYSNCPIDEHFRKQINWEWKKDISYNDFNSALLILSDDISNTRLYFDSNITSKSIIFNQILCVIEDIIEQDALRNKNTISDMRVSYYSYYYKNNLIDRKMQSYELLTQDIIESFNKSLFLQNFNGILGINKEINERIKNIQSKESDLFPGILMKYDLLSPYNFKSINYPLNFSFMKDFYTKNILKNIITNYNQYILNVKNSETINDCSDKFLEILKGF